MRSLLCPKFDFVEFTFKLLFLLAMLKIIGALNYDFAVQNVCLSLSLLSIFLFTAFFLLLLRIAALFSYCSFFV